MPVPPESHPPGPRRRGRGRAVHRIGALAGAAGLVAALALLAAPAASAADEPAKPTLTVLGADGLELLVGDPYGELGGDPLSGELRVTVDNPGTTALTPTIALVPTGSDAGCPVDGLQLTGAAPGSAAAGATTTYDLRIDVDPGCVGTTATLVVSGAAMTTSTAKVPTTRVIGGAYFWPPLVVALIAGFAFWAVARVRCRPLDRRIPTGDSWSFSGSWLTSISALTTALSGVLAASGFVTELLPGVPLGHFLGLSLTFGVLVVAAPLVFATYQVVDEEPADPDDPADPTTVPVLLGRLRGLVNAGALTCAGTAGLLAMFVVLTSLSGAGTLSKVVVAGLLVLVGVVVAVYVARSTAATVAASATLTAPAATAGSATSSVTQSVVARQLVRTSGLTGTF